MSKTEKPDPNLSQKQRERLAKEARVAARLRDNLRRRKLAAKKSNS